MNYRRTVAEFRALKEHRPCFAEAAVRWLDDHLDTSDRVFEWGAGSSTIWFAKRVRSVVSVEHQLEWESVLREVVGSCVALLLRPPKQSCTRHPHASDARGCFFDYARALDLYPEPTVVVVDGPARAACLAELHQQHHWPDVVVLDDAARYPTQDWLLEAGYARERFTSDPDRITDIYSL